MNILLVGQNLQIGGVQIALVNLIKALSVKEDYKIDVFLFGEGKLIEEVSDSVNVIQGSKALRLVATPFREVLKSNKKRDFFYRILLMLLVRIVGSDKFYKWLFNKQIEMKDYDVAISYFNDVPKSYFNQGTNQFVQEFVHAPVKIAWIHTDPIAAGFEKERCTELYKHFDKLVCVSDACAEKLKEFLPEYTDKITTVYNTFPIEEIHEKALVELYETDKCSTLSLITVTRIDNGSKNLGRIADVCRKLSKEGITNYTWTIVGDGPDLEKNIREIKDAGLSERVKYIGAKSNPFPYIAESDLFVLTSNYEGYPMVIQEALILGVPVLTTPYAAVKEQVEDGFNGIVTEMSSESLYSHLRKILENPSILYDLKINIRDYPVSNLKAENQLTALLKV